MGAGPGLLQVGALTRWLPGVLSLQYDAMPPGASPPESRHALWQALLPGGLLLLSFAGFLAFLKLNAALNPAPSAPPEGMVWIPPGTFRMGSDDPGFPESHPAHDVTIDGFWMDATEVTNEQFAKFVQATGYVTIAERKPDPAQFPGVPPGDLVPFSAVFTPPPQKVPLNNAQGWWKVQPGASWRHPEGPGSGLEGREQHPVVHVAFPDAEAYAAWAGKRLPTEAEWERASRGGLEGKRFLWGDELKPGGRWAANLWQGDFPHANSAEDGHPATAPVGSFPPNPYGLHDMAGNVWEWCSDWYREDYFRSSPSRSPKGPASSLDPREPGAKKRVQKGGSFLCSDQYCVRYLPGSRHCGEIETGSPHVGFRCARDAQ